jgi:hypothetical protein
MMLSDGRIAYHTDCSTWVDVYLHGMALDDRLYSMTVKPQLPLLKWSTRVNRKRKRKEGINDGNKCEQCREEMGVCTIKTTRNGTRSILCEDCLYQDILDVCFCCGDLAECSVINPDSTKMCRTCQAMECCACCGYWSGSSICHYCR